MKEAKYTRNNNLIIELGPNGGKTNNFKSINAAKRESRTLQMNLDGALGRGSVRSF